MPSPTLNITEPRGSTGAYATPIRRISKPSLPVLFLGVLYTHRSSASSLILAVWGDPPANCVACSPWSSACLSKFSENIPEPSLVISQLIRLTIDPKSDIDFKGQVVGSAFIITWIFRQIKSVKLLVCAGAKTVCFSTIVNVWKLVLSFIEGLLEIYK